MKRIPRLPKAQEPNSFTLVELLVVISIIVILISVLLAAVNGALKTAKRAKAYSTASGIQTAVTSYYTEYSLYPVPTGTTTDFALTDYPSAANGSAYWGPMIECLSGNIKPSTGAASPSSTLFTNSRGIAFLSMKSSDVDSTDSPVNPIPGTGSGTSQNNLYFNMALDGNYDGVIGGSGTTILPNFSTATLGNVPMGGACTSGVAIWANCNGTSGNNPNFYVRTY